jgi:hypothetical protein
MPKAEPTFGWAEAAAAMAVIVIVAFLVSWLVTDMLHVRRAIYIAILGLTVLTLGGIYLAWSGTSMTELVGSGWGWGLVGGIVAASLAAPLVRRLPSSPRPKGLRLGGLLLWEGVLYGSAEAALLAILPVLAVSQSMSEGGSATSASANAASGAAAIAGALLVIFVHHLGYAEFRARAGRRKLVGALATCGLQALAFLLTGNILAPLIAHILLHGQMILRGVQLPPIPRQRSGSPGLTSGTVAAKPYDVVASSS